MIGDVFLSIFFLDAFWVLRAQEASRGHLGQNSGKSPFPGTFGVTLRLLAGQHYELGRQRPGGPAVAPPTHGAPQGAEGDRYEVFARALTDLTETFHPALGLEPPGRGGAADRAPGPRSCAACGPRAEPLAQGPDG